VIAAQLEALAPDHGDELTALDGPELAQNLGSLAILAKGTPLRRSSPLKSSPSSRLKADRGQRRAVRLLTLEGHSLIDCLAIQCLFSGLFFLFLFFFSTRATGMARDTEPSIKVALLGISIDFAAR
jgi:hypothetical protein